MSGQSAIIGVGALEYPAEFQGASGQTLAELGISKIITLTSTYDHRVIQGAESGEFLKRVHQLLLGEDGFYDDIFTSLRLPYEPVRWVTDLDQGRAGTVDRTSRVLEIIDAYRTRGHLMADTDPLNYRQRRHPDLDIITHGLPVGPGPGIPGRRLQRPTVHEAPRRPRCAPRRLLPHRRRRVHAHS
jgi:2-oxoglutarate decarboxylase